MNQRSKYLFQNLGILTISNFSSKILVFLLVPLYTSVLSTTEYGTYDLAVSTVNLLFPLLTANIVDAVMRFSMDKSYSKDEIASIGLKYILRSIILISILLLIIQRFGLIKSIVGLEIYIFLYYTSCVLNQYFIQLAKGWERVNDMGIAGVLGIIVMLASNILFLLVFRWGLQGFFLANILAQVIPVLYYIIRLKIWKQICFLKISKQVEYNMIAYCLPLVCTTLGWWVNSTASKYTVTFICGLAANGILSVSYKIPSIINTLQGIFTQAWQISAIKEYGAKDTSEFYGKSFAYLNVFMSAVSSWLILLSKLLALILYSKEFYSAWQYVPFLLVSSVLNSASGFIGPILSAKRDSKSMAMSAVYGVGVNIILNITLVYLMGIQGAMIATVVSSYIIYIVRKRAVKCELIIENYWKVLATWGLLCLQAVIEIYTSAWYFEFVVMAVLFVINWSTLQEGVKMILGIIRRK